MVNSIEIAPSILGGDHAALGESVAKIAQAGLKWVHVDVMDGHFVPNLSFGSGVVKSLKKKFPQMFYDVHLMLDNPHLYVDSFAEAGADLISIHVEPDYPVAATLDNIHATGKKLGIVFNPKTEVGEVIPYLPRVDLVLVMSVQPGFGGQKFIEHSIEKVHELRALIEQTGSKALIEVDGGVNLETGVRLVEAGADALVAGNAVFAASDPEEMIRQLHDL